MHSQTDNPVHIDLESGFFEKCLEKGFPMLVFPEYIENRFLEDTTESKKKTFSCDRSDSSVPLQSVPSYRCPDGA